MKAFLRSMYSTHGMRTKRPRGKLREKNRPDFPFVRQLGNMQYGQLIQTKTSHALGRVQSKPTNTSTAKPLNISQSSQQGTLQRKRLKGNDHGGNYVIDDEKCTLTYNQDWYFDFQTKQTPAQRQQYMQAAKTQIQSVWSGKHPLIPDKKQCPCHPQGLSVPVSMHPQEGARQGRGFTARVTPSAKKGFANPPSRRISLGTKHEKPTRYSSTISQHVTAHEFGHAIGLPDEYSGWAKFFSIEG